MAKTHQLLTLDAIIAVTGDIEIYPPVGNKKLMFIAIPIR